MHSFFCNVSRIAKAVMIHTLLYCRACTDGTSSNIQTELQVADLPAAVLTA